MMNIFEKHIILYGSPQLIKDFEYLYEKAQIAGYLLDQSKTYGMELLPSRPIYEIDKLQLRDLHNRVIVICNAERNLTLENKLGQLNCVEKEDFFYLKDFFLFYNPIFLERGNRKLVIWGTGNEAQEVYRNLQQRNIDSEVEFFIDNFPKERMFEGKEVKSPAEIIDIKELYIIVASRLYHWEIYDQLNEYGLKYSRDYIHSTEAAEDTSGMLEKLFFSDKRYSASCVRPFGSCDLIGTSLFLCCPDFLSVPCGRMEWAPFLNCWNSYKARIFRLSICNKSYVFCDKHNCDLIDFDKVMIDSESEMVLTDYDQKAFEYPKSLIVGIDRSCNLSCPSCRQKVYAAGIEERKRLYRQSEDLLENVIPYVDRLWLAGSGEVFFSPVYRDILQDARCKKRKSISILSNGTLFNETNWKLLDDIYERIEVIISMDGYKDETIEKLRRGANSKQLKSNLEFLGRLRAKNKIQKLILSCVVQSSNVGELYDLLEYCKYNFVDRIQFLKIQNHHTYSEEEFEQVSVFEQNGGVKEKYLSYFTPKLLKHPLADWFNISKEFGMREKERLDVYDIV